jgi:hypothetical protein
MYKTQVSCVESALRLDHSVEVTGSWADPSLLVVYSLYISILIKVSKAIPVTDRGGL